MTPEQKAENVARTIVGTVDSLPAATKRLGWPGIENDSLFCAVLDRLAFECADCGIWLDTAGNEFGYRLCADCADQDWC